MRSRISTFLLLIIAMIALSHDVVQIEAQDTAPPGTPEINEQTVSFSVHQAGGTDGDRFIFELAAGESSSIDVTITNYGDAALDMRVYVADIIPKINGGIDSKPYDQEMTDVATWIDFPMEVITGQPEVENFRKMQVKVPEGTAPGQYVAAMVLETANPMGTGMLQQIIQKVIAIYITVPGPIEPSVDLGEPDVMVASDLAILTFPVSNTGNIRLDLAGTVTMTDSAGLVAMTGPLVLGPVYAGQTVTASMVLPNIPSEGHYEVDIALEDVQQGVVTSSVPGFAVSVAAQEAAVLTPVTISAFEIVPVGDPIQLVTVDATVMLEGTSFPATRATLHIFHNGTLLENYVLADNLPMAVGENLIQQRYLPIAGWQSGTYEFGLTIESIDSSTGSTGVLATSEVPVTLVVP